MKKIITTILIMCLLCSSVFAAPIEKKDRIFLYSAYISDVGKDSRNLKNNDLDNGKFQIKSKNIIFEIQNDGSITLDGQLNNLDLNLTAFPKGIVNENVYVLSGEDKASNFEILYVSYEKNIQNSLMYFRDVYEKNQYNDIIKIYTRPYGSQDIAIIEVFNTNLDLFEKVQMNRTVGSEDVSIEQFWYGKIFEPKVNEEVNIGLRNSTDYNYGTYTYEYNHMGADIKQVFKISRYVENPSTVDSNDAFTTSLKVVDEYTECLWYPNENSDNTHMMIDEVRIDIAIDEGDACSEYYIDGTVKRGGSLDVDFGWNTSIPLGSVASIDFNYNKTINNLDLNNTHEILNNGSDGYYRELGTRLEDGNKLDAEGHYFTTKWLLTNYDHQTKSGQKFKVKFRYHMVNLLDYTHWINGDKSYTETKSYTSRP